MRIGPGRALVVASIIFLTVAGTASAADPRVERGAYLVSIAGCNDCHTPGYFLGKPDFARRLGGSDVGFATPDGTFIGPNLTPDPQTGLGSWSVDQIVTAFTTGKRPDGRMLAPIMPYDELASLTHADALAVAAYLKSLPPVSHKVPGPLAAHETPPGLVMTLVPGAALATLPHPP